ncbi:right-handed parallel beta-helix repeat-containing protein [Caenimonas terrae]|uniref:Right-handed parallel beta-helix repeat-containing protein n=1 Tax=Caenimonas terrae TaxID=696074 RepID=A0ABW0NH52_9BURK
MLKDPALRDPQGTLKETVTIRLGPGTYRLEKTLDLDAASSGSAQHPVNIEGPKDASAIISGGRAVGGFTAVTDRGVLMRLPETARAHVLQANLAKQGITDYGKQARHGWGAMNVPTALEVFYRGHPMTLARWPNQGFAKIATTPDGEKGSTFTVEAANLDAWKDEPDLLATGYWFQNWADATIPIKALDLVTRHVTLAPPAPPYGLKIGQPVFFQNALSELDRPGEWYLDNARGMLYFWPPQPLQEGEVQVSTLERLLVMDNVSHLHIGGVTFGGARGDAITIRGGHDVSIANSVIRDVGNRAAVIGGQDNGLTDMVIEDIGEGGVVLAGGDRQTLTPANLYVARSTIRRFARVSRTYQPAILMSGVGNRAEGNKIYDAPHTAILFTGNDHLISGNEIFDVCKETGDAGAIYTGRDWSARGTVISGNHIHDIPANVRLGRTKGVYLDDQASGITVRGNYFERVDEAVFIGGGRDNLIEDNNFTDTPTGIHLDARGTSWQKAMTEASGGTLRAQLTAVPYKSAPYRRYLHLATILEDDPGMPKYNVARNNLFIGDVTIRIHKDAESGISITDASENVVSEIH